MSKRIARDLYDGEDEDVKALVTAKLKERANVSVMDPEDENDVDCTPVQYLR